MSTQNFYDKDYFEQFTSVTTEEFIELLKSTVKDEKIIISELYSNNNSRSYYSFDFTEGCIEKYITEFWNNINNEGWYVEFENDNLSNDDIDIIIDNSLYTKLFQKKNTNLNEREIKNIYTNYRLNNNI